MYTVKTPWLFRKLYPEMTWNKDRDAPCIYLTFDDGPIPVVTPFVLKILKHYDAKATFFCIGDNVHKHPEIFEQVRHDGHAVGNHTYNHLKGWDTPDETYLNNFLKADEFLKSNLFRPPYGRMKRSQAKLLKQVKPGTEIIMWDVLSADFDVHVTPKKCLQNVIKNTENGSIVLFHDSLKARERMEYALPLAMDYWHNKGYQFLGLGR